VKIRRCVVRIPAAEWAGFMGEESEWEAKEDAVFEELRRRALMKQRNRECRVRPEE
jgi:hypothetical protein